MTTTKKPTDANRTRKKTTKTPGREGAKGRRSAARDAEPKAIGGGADAPKGGKRSGAPGSPARPAAQAQRPPRDARLPEAGTVLRKVDRHGKVRCECTVKAGGIRYGGQVYRSLSAAAVAAAAKLGIKGAQNGYIFWGLSKPARPGEDPVARLQRFWERYEVCARTVIATAPAERKPEVIAAIERHRSVELTAA
jgi:hypothetical protein